MSLSNLVLYPAAQQPQRRVVTIDYERRRALRSPA
jgi:hypothetical protein